ncbi:MAG: DUF2294 family protein [Planctomycetes bacterium]|nr:DUF2294 family protein [Planctomycetota bacterium]
MDNEKKLQQQVADVTKSFLSSYMSMNPESIRVDIHSDCIIVTLHRAFPPAETAYIQDALSRDRLERFYKDSYDGSKLILESALDKVSHKRITESCISIHPALDKCVIVFSISSNTTKEIQSN